jgi:hypothetical protein
MISAALSAFTLVCIAAAIGWSLLAAVTVLTRPLLRLLPDFLALTIVCGGAVLTAIASLF